MLLSTIVAFWWRPVHLDRGPQSGISNISNIKQRMNNASNQCTFALFFVFLVS